MKTLSSIRFVLMAFFLFAGFMAMAQTTTSTKQTNPAMKTYLIEREIPNAGKLTAPELKGISQTSCGVLKDMGPQIKWIHSYVVKDKIYCVYQAENEQLIRDHGAKGGFPVTNIMEIANTISPATAD